MRVFLRFFFSPSAPVAALVLPAVFFALLLGSAAGLGAFEAVEAAGALLAVEAGYRCGRNALDFLNPSSILETDPPTLGAISTKD